jgi:hypothetical protein
MEKLLLVAFVVASLGCAESDNSSAIKKDGGKDSISTTGDGGVLPTGDSGGGGDDTSIPGDDTSTGSCTPASGSGSTCGTFPQCGCASGENCDVKTTAGMAACTPAGSVGVNDACSDFGQCVKGTSCVGGLCRPFCGGDGDCTSPGPGACKPVQDSSGASIPGFQVCLTTCDPLNPSAACGSQGCTLDGEGSSACVGAGSATGTGACSSDPNACAPGYVCLSSGDCLHWCRVGGSSSDCSGTGGTCQSFSTPVYKGSVEYGVCAP